MDVQPVIPIWVGYDGREAAVFHAFQESVIAQASQPISFAPLHGPMLDGFDGQQDGTNRFIYSRYLVPALMGFKGWAIFVDGDMIVTEDIVNLWELRDFSKAVMVVKHDYKTKFHTKLIGTPLEAKNESYPRKNWSSVVLWNCGHPKNRVLTKEFVAKAGGKFLHRFEWLDDKQIGELPKEWNWLVREYPEDKASLYHFTLGAPGFRTYLYPDYKWHKYLLKSIHMIGEDPERMVRRAKDYADV